MCAVGDVDRFTGWASPPEARRAARIPAHPSRLRSRLRRRPRKDIRALPPDRRIYGPSVLRARPPRVSWASNSRTPAPPSAHVIAAVSPATPPPMTVILSIAGTIGAHWPRVKCQLWRTAEGQLPCWSSSIAQTTCRCMRSSSAGCGMPSATGACSLLRGARTPSATNASALRARPRVPLDRARPRVAGLASVRGCGRTLRAHSTPPRPR
jgi:hypothetical protein